MSAIMYCIAFLVLPSHYHRNKLKQSGPALRAHVRWPVGGREGARNTTCCKVDLVTHVTWMHVIKQRRAVYCVYCLVIAGGKQVVKGNARSVITVFGRCP